MYETVETEEDGTGMRKQDFFFFLIPALPCV